MTVAEALKSARSGRYRHPKGGAREVEFLPGMSTVRLDAIEAEIGAPLPEDYRELALLCGGMGFLQGVDFSGEAMDFGMEDALPHGLAFAADGMGNFWVVDCQPSREPRAQVFFACHDPPVLVYQADGMAAFLQELIREHEEPRSSFVHHVSETRVHEVYRDNPGAVSRAEVNASSEVALRRFAEGLDERFWIVDLRLPTPGEGLSWGRFGPRTEVRRWGTERLFAYAAPEKRPGVFSRLFKSRSG